MSKEWFIEAHEREVADYMDRHPNASWATAYDRTADRAYDRMRDEMADAADMARTRMKDASASEWLERVGPLAKQLNEQARKEGDKQ